MRDPSSLVEPFAAEEDPGDFGKRANIPIRRCPVRSRRDEDDAVRAAGDLAGEGLLSTIDHLGEDVLDRAQAEQTREAYCAAGALAEAGLSAAAEVSVKLSAVGQALPGDGEQIALEHARAICRWPLTVGTTVTLDMEDHTTTDSTLGMLRELRADFP